MFIIKYRKIFYALSTVLVATSLFAVAFWGINFGIDFTGGSILEVNYLEARPDKNSVQEILASTEIDRSFSIRETGENGYIIRSQSIDDGQKDAIVSALNSISASDSAFGSTSDSGMEEVRFNTIGPTLGSELRGKAVLSIIVVVLAIILFVAFAFRHVSRPVSSWKYGLVAIIAFVHDVSVPLGLFAFLGQFHGVEVDTLFVIAILVVLGYSINDTIIVFDRIRENLKDIPDKARGKRFAEVVGQSLRQTFARSINTSLTTLIALVALFFIGGEATKWFSLALISGIIAGTYSSIFFAAPMLITLNKSKNQ